VVADEISKSPGSRAIASELDVTNRESVTGLIKTVKDHFGKIDILVNNSGVAWGAPFEEMPYEKWELVLRTNLTGTFLMTQGVVPEMEKQRWGRIINVSSVAGLVSPPEFMNTVGYTASKGGMIALTRELAVKLALHGITVNAIAPNFFPSKMTTVFIQKFGDKIRDTTPMKRLGEEDDLKGAIVFLASQGSSYITGQVLAIDGGYTAA